MTPVESNTVSTLHTQQGRHMGQYLLYISYTVHIQTMQYIAGCLTSQSFLFSVNMLFSVVTDSEVKQVKRLFLPYRSIFCDIMVNNSNLKGNESYIIFLTISPTFLTRWSSQHHAAPHPAPPSPGPFTLPCRSVAHPAEKE